MPGGWGSDFDDDDPEKVRIAARELQNGIRQMQFVLELVRASVNDPGSFAFTPALLCDLQQLAVDGLSVTAGAYRTRDVEITGQGKAKPLVPPPWAKVPALVDELCRSVMTGGREAVSLAAYVLWRVNWIHPFDDGNGRTARAAAYLVLSVALGQELPGVPTNVIELLQVYKHRYYSAPDEADKLLASTGKPDVSAMTMLLRELLEEQLEAARQA